MFLSLNLNLHKNEVSTKNQKIQYAIRKNPLLIGSLLKDTSINKGMVYRELKKAVPCRIGIEFELAGDFRAGFANKYLKPNLLELFQEEIKRSKLAPRPTKNNLNIDKIMTKHYGVHEIRSDAPISLRDDDIYEVRVSIKDYHQLKGLYKFMQDLPEFCRLHENGGIHIHVDLSEYFPLFKISERLVAYLKTRLDEVEAIFPKYTGTYNKRLVGYRAKSTYINISSKESLEYRIAPLSFDYETVITWVISCIKFRNKFIHQCRLKKTSVIKEKVITKSEISIDLPDRTVMETTIPSYINDLGYTLYRTNMNEDLRLSNLSTNPY